jgi:hypothetical protein
MIVTINTTSIALDDQMSVVADKDVAFCTLADGVALLDMRSGTYYSLNPVAAHIWSALHQPIRICEIFTLVESRFDVSHVDCRRDVLALIGDMSQSGLVTVSDVDVS